MIARRTPLRILAASALVAAVLLGGSPRAVSQDGLEEALLYGRPWMVMASSKVKFAVEAATKALAKKDWDRAALEIQPLFGEYANHVVELDNETFRGARAWTIEWVETWPEEARAAQAAFADRLARGRYEAGLAARDRDRLTEVWRSHPRSSFAARALNARSILDLGAGRLDGAADALGRLLARRDLDDVVSRPEALVRQVWVLSRLGRLDEARAALAELDGSTHSVRTGDREGPAATVARRFVEAATAAGATGRPDGAPSSHDGGRPDHAGLADEAPELEGRLQWERGEPHLDVRERRLDARDRGEHLRLDSWLPLRPILHEGVLIAHDGNNVVAVDAFTGETLWFFEGPTYGIDGRTNTGTVYSASAADGVVYVNLEVPRPETAKEAEREFQGVSIVYPIPQRRLFAFDVRTGRLLWSHQDAALEEGHPDASFLRRMTVNSPPLVVGDRLFVPMSYFAGRYEIVLAAFDAKTGRLVWQTHVANGQMELNLFGRPVKEAAPSAIACDGTLLYLCTNVGVVAAIDARAGYVEWIRGYPTIPIPFSRRWWRVEERPATWTNPAPIVKDGIVYVTPTDSRHLIALDARDASTVFRFDGGEPSRGFRSPRRSPQVREMIGVDERFLYVAGPYLYAIDRRTGKAVHRADFESDEETRGRGVVTPTVVLCPTERALYRFSTKDLDLVSRTPWPIDDFDSPAGNLLSQRGLLVVSAQSTIRAFIDWPSIFRDLEARIRRSPSDVELRLKLGRVTLHRGVTPEVEDAGSWLDRAEAVFREAKALAASAPAGERERLAIRAAEGLFDVEMTRARRAREAGELDEARKSLARSVERAPTVQSRVSATMELYRLESLTTGPAAARRVLRELEARDGGARADLDPGRQGEASVGAYALRLAVEQSDRLGDPTGAVDDLQALIERYPNEPIDGEDAAIWARREIAALIEHHGRGIYRAHEAAANRALRAAIESSMESELEAVVTRWPSSGAAPLALLRLSRQRFAAGDDGRCATLLRRYLREYPGHDDTASALGMLFEVSDRRGHVGAAVAALRRLRDRHAGATILIGEDRIEAKAFATEKLASEPYRSAEARSGQPWIELPLAEAWRIDRGRDSMARLLAVSGTPAPAAEDLAFLITNGALEALSAPTGRRVWRTELPSVRPRGAFCEGRLVVVADQDVIGLDPATGDVVWRVPTERAILDFATGEDAIFLLMHDPRRRRAQELVALSGASGRPIWHRTYDGSHWPLTAPDDGVVREDAIVLARREDSTVQIIDPITGMVVHRLTFREGLSRAPLLTPAGLIAFHGSAAIELWSTQTGERVWRWELEKGTFVRTTLLMRDALLVTDTKDTIRVIELARGTVRWTRPTTPETRPVTWRSEAADDRHVYAVYHDAKSGAHEIVALDAKDGTERWTTPLVVAATLQVSAVATPQAILYHTLAYDHGANAWSATTVLIDPATGRRRQELGLDLGSEISDFVLDRGRVGFFAQGTVVYFTSAK